MEQVKINALELENVKRIKAVKLKPTENGLSIIGGNNNQGKTSVLDAITWALGGERYRPSQPQREGSMLPPSLKVVLNNGIVVERKGKNGELKVTDPSGKKAGQTLLNEFISELALNLPKFMDASGKEKAATLLKIIGVGDQLGQLEKKETELYNERLYVGRTADQKVKFAREQPFYPDVPDNLVSPSELIRQQQAILAKNGENERKRMHAVELERKADALERELSITFGQAAEIEKKLKKLEEEYNQAAEDREAAFHVAASLEDESTAELEKNIADIDEINRKIRANLDKEKAEEDAKQYTKKYQELSQAIDQVREQKKSLLEGAALPLPGLSVMDGELTYQGQKWDNMSGSQKLVVSTAIIRKLNPNCGFVLLDKLEQMDMNTLKEFGEWLEKEGLQAIATRVSTGDECSVIIEDGYAVSAQDSTQTLPKVAEGKWKAGEF